MFNKLMSMGLMVMVSVTQDECDDGESTDTPAPVYEGVIYPADHPDWTGLNTVCTSTSEEWVEYRSWYIETESTLPLCRIYVDGIEAINEAYVRDVGCDLPVIKHWQCNYNNHTIFMDFLSCQSSQDTASIEFYAPCQY